MTEEVRIKLSTVRDTVELVPYLLGFQPEESLVMMAVQNGVVAVTARIDLDFAADPEYLRAALIERVAARFPKIDAWFLAYSDDEALAWEVLHEAKDCLWTISPRASSRITYVNPKEARWVTDSHDGPFGDVSYAGKLAATAVSHGLIRRDSRKELEELLQGPDESDWIRLLLLATPLLDTFADDSYNRVGAMRDLLDARLSATEPMTEEEALTLALLVRDGRARDVAMLSVTRENAERHFAVWQQVVTKVPSMVSGYAIGLLGLISWVSGEGALVTICAERAEELIGSDHSLMEVLSALIDNVVPPSEWAGFREHLYSKAEPDIQEAVLVPA